jgi:hypothetical protein
MYNRFASEFCLKPLPAAWIQKWFETPAGHTDAAPRSIAHIKIPDTIVFTMPYGIVP